MHAMAWMGHSACLRCCLSSLPGQGPGMPYRAAPERRVGKKTLSQMNNAGNAGRMGWASSKKYPIRLTNVEWPGWRLSGCLEGELFHRPPRRGGTYLDGTVQPGMEAKPCSNGFLSSTADWPPAFSLCIGLTAVSSAWLILSRPHSSGTV
ncbi:hypothetical protein MAPG_11466 [Magnaporthiopsis poae ATCC 64411]|uniref:Uncharacterized protein n=1 Tax=Magnaporthiopsis poae (strain ATCC 64411 / 73-15) TaxID=644358 RepID=A0A0C4EFC3_MAGP6|nr:hypothetical protein MAPG_11466 [Magnaporthiopsis poae ATCC 64411]